jgi:hypothetical protein
MRYVCDGTQACPSERRLHSRDRTRLRGRSTQMDTDATPIGATFRIAPIDYAEPRACYPLATRTTTR